MPEGQPTTNQEISRRKTKGSRMWTLVSSRRKRKAIREGWQEQTFSPSVPLAAVVKTIKESGYLGHRVYFRKPWKRKPYSLPLSVE